MNFLPAWPLASNALFFFGFLLFCRALGGDVMHRWPWLPSITGFMRVGLIAGPNVLNLSGGELKPDTAYEASAQEQEA